MREQPNIFAARITLGTAATCQKPSYAEFDIHVALVQYTSRALFVDVLTRNTLNSAFTRVIFMFVELGYISRNIQFTVP